MTTKLTFLDIFVTNIVLYYQLCMIFKKFIQLTLIYFAFSSAEMSSNGGATYIISKIIAEDNLNVANLLQHLKNFISKTTQQNY